MKKKIDLKIIQKNLNNIEKNFNLLNDIYYVKKIEKACNLIIDCLKKKNKIIFCGNGGSASDSNHLSTELVGRYLKNRKAYPAISLSSNSSLLTALGNDYGFDKIFLRQIESIGSKGDVLFASRDVSYSYHLRNNILFLFQIGL